MSTQAATTDGRRRAAWLDPIVILAAVVTIPLTLVEVAGQNGTSYQLADWAVWLVFVADLVIGFTVAEDRRRYPLRAWLKVAVVLLSFPLLPSVFGFTRAARLIRILQLARLIGFAAAALPALKAMLGRRGLVYLTSTLLVLIVVSGAVMSIVEPQTVRGNLWDGMWWAIVTATTVGYGDISPSSVAGRLVAVALMVLGIGLTATLGASLAAHFVKSDQEADLSQVVERPNRVEALLLELTDPGSLRGRR